MTKTRFFSVLLVVSFLFVLMSATANAALWEVPDTLGPGDTFRWVFVTSGTRDAKSSDIGDYNQFVNDAADAAALADPTGMTVTGVLGKSSIASIADIDWRAIGSTSSVDAIVNIGPSTGGIYTPTGEPLATGTSHLFDSWSYPLVTTPNVTEYGEMTPSMSVWTGSIYTGEKFGFATLGGDPLGLYIDVMSGSPHSTGTEWLTAYRWKFDMQLPFYAISEQLTVVPVPGALILAATGMLSATVGLKRLRRKDQE